MRSSSSPSTDAVDADRAERVLEGDAADVHQAAEHVGGEAGALLVGEDGDAQRSVESTVRSPRCVSITSRPASTPEVAVEDAAGGDGVDVAAHHHRRVVAVGRPGADDVADAVDVDPQAEVAHPRHDEVAADAGRRR